MSFKKDIAIGNVGKLSVSESAGVATLEISVSESIGGGQVAGVVTASAGAKAQVDAKHLIDLGMDLAALKFPVVASAIAGAKAMIDAELAKV